MAITFNVGTSTSDIRAQLAAQGLPSAKIESVLKGAKVSGDLLVGALEVDVAKLNPQAAVAATAGLQAPKATAKAATAERSRYEKLTDDLKKFMKDEVVTPTLENEIKIDAKLGPVKLSFKNDVEDGSDDPVQKQFLATHEGSRIASTTLTIEGDTDSLLKVGTAFDAKIKGGYEITIEMPMEKFESVEAKEQWRGRFQGNLKELISKPGDFWDNVRQLELPAGARIIRTCNIEGGATLPGETALSGTATSKVTFTSRFNPGNTVDIEVATQRTDVLGASRAFQGIGLSAEGNYTGRQVHSYNGLSLVGDQAAQTLAGLKKAMDWKNGLLPNRLDTEVLDTIGKGRHLNEVAWGGKAGLSRYLPLTAVTEATAGASLSASITATGMVSVTLPDATAAGRVDYKKAGDRVASAFLTGDAKELIKDPVPGLAAHRTGVLDTSRGVTATLSKAVALLPGYANLGPVASFAHTTEGHTVIGTKLNYRDGNKADVMLYKVDVDKVVNEFKLSMGLTVSSDFQTEMTQSVADHLLYGTSLDRLAGKLTKQPLRQLQKYLDKINPHLTNTQTNTAESVQVLRFANFDLTSANDQKALAALTAVTARVGDEDAVKQAIAAGHLAETVDTDTTRNVGNLVIGGLGIQLLKSDITSWTSATKNTVYGNGNGVASDVAKTFTVLAAGVDMTSESVTEQKLFNTALVTTHSAASVEGAVPLNHLAIVVGYNDRDSSLYAKAELGMLDSVADAAALVALEKRTEPGSRDLGTFFGKGRNLGDAVIGLKGVLSGQGAANLIAMEPAEVGRRAVDLAAGTLKTTPPPYLLATPGVSFALGVGNGVGLSIEQLGVLDCFALVNDESATVYAPDKIRKELTEWKAKRSEVAAHYDEFMSLSDAQLTEFGKRAAARAVIALYSRATDTSADSKLTTPYYNLTGGRSISDDAWMLDQGSMLAERLNDPAMVAVRAKLQRGEALTDVDMKPIVTEWFPRFASKNRPGRTALFGQAADRRAMVAWLTVISVAGNDEAGKPLGSALLEIDGKNVKRLYITPGVANSVAELRGVALPNGAVKLNELRAAEGVPGGPSLP